MAISVSQYAKTWEEVASFAEVKEGILAAAAEATQQNVLDVEVLLDTARYTVDEPLVLSAEEHPELANVRLTIKGKESMRPTVSGLRVITGSEFTPVAGTPDSQDQFEKDEKGEYPKFHDFFRGGERLKMAASPVWRNPFPLLPEERSGEKKLEGLYVPVALAKAVEKKGVGATQLHMYVQWEHYVLRVKDVDLSVTKDVNGEAYALVTFYEEFDEYFVKGMHRANNVGNRESFFINNPVFLTEPDTFVYDWYSGTVYVVPANPASFAREQYGYTTLSNLLVVKGMKNVTIKDITFFGLTSSFICDSGYFGRLSNFESRMGRLRDAAVLTSDVQDLLIEDCSFIGLGGNGVQLCDRTVRATVKGCTFRNIGMGGFSAGNYRSGCSWDNAEHQTYHVELLNNYFENIAYDYPSTACVWLGYCDGALISHNTIKNCAYSGISAGDGYSKVGFFLGERVNLRDVEISYNRVMNFMDVNRDGGAVYVTGANCTVEHEGRFNSIHHNFAALTHQKDHDRRGYYLDGAASNWDVYDNVMDNSALPLFTQYHVPSQYTHHNRVWNFYSTTAVDAVGNNKPERDTLLGFYAVESDLETLFEKYPAAKEIYENSGCKF
ncbi:MAG: right-handed parallel beta-helix repeat-containing protein [Clostridia bacterium]|nr:right-handed parallel beta-helix repeat-containing protein [Clostridia bacterium]